MSQRVTDILEIAKLQGITQSEIAEMLRVNQSSISRTLGGIPALSSEHVLNGEMCTRLSIDEEFLSEKSDYPFLPSSFVNFRIKGLRARSRSLAWLELLLKYSEKLKVLLLLQRAKERVEVACVKDHRGSIFLVFMEIPISWKSFFDFAQKEQLSDKIVIVVRDFFDKTVLSPYRTADDIAHYDRNAVDSMIEGAFSDILTDQERKLIHVVRNSIIPLEKIIQRIERMKT